MIIGKGETVSAFAATTMPLATEAKAEQRSDEKTLIVPFAEMDRRLTAQARAAGARHFAWVGSKPWVAWTDYRRCAELGQPKKKPRQKRGSSVWRFDNHHRGAVAATL